MWIKTNVAKPIENRPIVGMDSGGVEHKLIFWHNLFWFPDMSMYVYFTPQMWKYVD